MRAIVIGLLLAGAARADTSVPSPLPGTASFELERARAELIAAQRNLLRTKALQTCGSTQALDQAEDAYLGARADYARVLAAGRVGTRRPRGSYR